ncbi:fumarylacetoacetate hydrolase family protein [Cryobacterium sp. SO2]|uniref:fumarylacetoacetate hydrolase family protein n=1 Tax=Cryobacterium sp. SO2 TaxID=1897060 RepID=UPI00223CE72F|nr:fumarylacetoacetate hydrolase family protein [Cryobacterium sp. SO2]WEO77297.1 fumarylacetoacetate hydrolase family protein [Cryobacterium sp. SO2]
MKLAQLVDADNRSRLAAVRDGEALILQDLDAGFPSRLEALIADSSLADVQAAVMQADPRLWSPLARFRTAPPIQSPPKIVAIGVNYVDHATEQGANPPEIPIVFALWQSSLSGDGDTITWDGSLTKQVDFEVELGVILGRDARDVSVDEALTYVFGYTVINDLSARDLQFRDQQWSRSKSLDGFTPIGPVVVTADEIPDPQSLDLWCVVDGLPLQRANTREMHRGVATLISYLSRGMTLEAGTVISTGTPGGVGYFRDPQVFLVDGSTVTVGVAGIGELTTHCRVTPGLD